MARYAVAIEKSTLWRGAQEVFSNVYHYNLATNLDEALAMDLVDQIATAEKQCHSPEVNFIQGRVWSTGGPPASNETIVIRDIGGTGTTSVTGGMYVESTLVVRVDTARNTSTGRKIYLRKYYHTCGVDGGSTPVYEGRVQLSTAQQAPAKTCLESLRELTLSPGGILVVLCAPAGQQVSDLSTVSVLPYVHTRQFKQ